LSEFGFGVHHERPVRLDMFTDRLAASTSSSRAGLRECW
jgi:hypothetical protein